MSQRAGSVAKVGVVEVEWNQESAETVASGESGKPKVMWSPADVERAARDRFVRQMREANVSVVASQKTIHRELKKQLLSSGIIPLERLSLRYIRAVACITGAPCLGTRHCASCQGQLSMVGAAEMMPTVDLAH